MKIEKACAYILEVVNYSRRGAMVASKVRCPVRRRERSKSLFRLEETWIQTPIQETMSFRL